MKYFYLNLLLVFAICSCSESPKVNSPHKYIDFSIEVDSLNRPLDSTQGYFPLEIFRDTSIFVGYDTFTVNWYSKHLKAMKEPLLFNKSLSKEVYRFTWLRTFHNPVVIRVEKSGRYVQIQWKVCSGSGGYEPGEIIQDGTKKISFKSWKRMQELIKIANYWDLSTMDKSVIGFDGSHWILEGVKDEEYQVVDRWTPKSGKYYDLCNFILGLTGLKIYEKNKY